MKKIRINELARDLEVKAHLILDKLPELGVTEKKTHSSSVDEDVAEKLREIFVLGEPGYREDFHEPPVASREEQDAPKNGAAHEASNIEHQKTNTGGHQPERGQEVKSAESNRGEGISGSVAVEDPPAAPPVEEPKPAGRVGLRPPLAGGAVRPPFGGGLRPPQAPVRPQPMVAAPPTPPVPVSAAPVVVEPPVVPPTPEPPAPVAAEPVAPTAPTRPQPPQVRPIPSAPSASRPGQVLSGPRAPLPPGMSTPRPPMVPGAPRPQGPRPQVGQPLRPSGGPQRPGLTPGAPIAPRMHQSGGPSQSSGQPQGGNRPLVGQPAPRPVVPPRPDLVAKLRDQQKTAAPGAPAARPPMPSRPSSGPAPGRPIFPGSAPRPGGPGLPSRPGMGPQSRTGPGQRPGGPRPMHPTTRGLPGPVGLVPAPGIAPDQQRRPPGRGTTRPQQRPREREAEERTLRPIRRERDSGPPPISRDITISDGVTVKELSEKLDVRANLVIKKLLDRGIFATINQTLDAQLATEMAREFGASTSTVTFEEEAMQDVEILEDAKDLVKRPPVVTIMGHVDHGKTSLLDAIRQANVAAREAGGITQHIGAYYIEKNGEKIVFIDTPGHEAFTRMRSRGARITDIVVLVVAADDGVMPQTIEAIDHARAAKVPIIVAINKVDKADAQVDRIKQQLSDRGLLAEDWGGDVVMVPVSARTKQGVDTLLEMILLVAEIQNLRANPTRPGTGSVIESKLDRGRGPVATVLVRNGTLRVGEFFICGQVFGKVRAMLNDRGEQVREAGPSIPVEVLGLDGLPEAGDEFQVVTDTAKAKQIVLYREEKAREEARAKNKRMTLEQFNKQMAVGEVKELNLILKADVGGSAEVLRDSLQKLSTDKVRINVIHSGVGAINESDVLLANASAAIVIGFNVKPERNAAATAEQEKVQIRLHSVIYHLTDEIKKAMTGLLEPVYREIPRGKAEVRGTFRVTKVGNVAGCLVTEGKIDRSCLARVIREGVVIHTGKVATLRRFKDDVSEVRSGMECGITLENYGDYQVGDLFEFFITERMAPDLGA